ncbi:MAG: glycine/sarcosine/betaine reductase selenoprotein B family protein [Candidatus Binataceae bacterium]
MQPIRYVERLNAHYREQGFPPYRWGVNEDAPLTPLAKPLSRSTIMLLTSGGVSHRNVRPFNPLARNDLRVDALASTVAPQCLVINDDYYNHRDADGDINCIFPIERLRELAEAGIIGAVAPHHYSGFMGRIYTRSAVLNEAAPALARQLKEERVDAAALVPA